MSTVIDSAELISAVETWLIDEHDWPEPEVAPAPVTFQQTIAAPELAPVSLNDTAPVPLHAYKPPAPRRAPVATPTITVAEAVRQPPAQQETPWALFGLIAAQFGLAVTMCIAGESADWPLPMVIGFLGVCIMTIATVFAAAMADSARAEAEGRTYGLCSPSRAANITGRTE